MTQQDPTLTQPTIPSTAGGAPPPPPTVPAPALAASLAPAGVLPAGACGAPHPTEPGCWCSLPKGHGTDEPFQAHGDKHQGHVPVTDLRLVRRLDTW